MTVYEVLTSPIWPRIFAWGIVLLIGGFMVDYALLPRFPRDMPCMGYEGGFLGHVKSNILYFFRHKKWIDEGYIKYSKKNMPFLVAAGLSRPPDVVLPRSMLPWLSTQPDTAVDARMAHGEIIYGEYNFLEPEVVRDAIGVRAISRWLNRALPGLIPALETTVARSVDKALGHVGSEWTTVKLWDVWLSMVPSVTNRVLAGEMASQDPEYLDAMIHFTHAVLRNCVLLRFCPALFHPVVARLLSRTNRKYWRQAHARILPIIQKRIDDMVAKSKGELQDWQEPEDLITWLIRQALAEKRPEELNASLISMRLLPLEFASIDTTVPTGVLWMLDLLSSSPDVIAALTEEIRTHKPADGAPWSKDSLLSLVKMDSSIRESQRLSNFHSTLIERVVVPRDGLRLPDTDWVLPQGAHLTVNLNGCHHDDALYPDAASYDAMRFARIREERSKQSKEDTDAERANSPLGMVSMNDHHFPFGHGRFICPGRFFVAHELRLIAANLLLNFEFKMLPERPKNRFVGAGMIPPFGVCVEVRRKAKAA